jgi:hypothetical protein
MKLVLTELITVMAYIKVPSDYHTGMTNSTMRGQIPSPECEINTQCLLPQVPQF